MRKKSSSNKEETALHPPPENFETATAELEQIVAGMETGQMSLEDALSAYKTRGGIVTILPKYTEKFATTDKNT